MPGGAPGNAKPVRSLPYPPVRRRTGRCFGLIRGAAPIASGLRVGELGFDTHDLLAPSILDRSSIRIVHSIRLMANWIRKKLMIKTDFQQSDETYPRGINFHVGIIISARS